MDYVTHYNWGRKLNVAIKHIVNVPESGQLIDEETYSFDRPIYNLEMRVSTDTRKALERMFENQLEEYYDDGVVQDIVTMSSYVYHHQIGENIHLVAITLLGSES